MKAGSPHAAPTPAPARRTDIAAVVLGVVISALLLVMFARVLQLQLSPPPQLKPAMGTRQGVQPDQPLRGDIMDRRGRLLCATRFAYRAVCDPTQLEPKALAQAKAKMTFDEVVVELGVIAGRKPGLIAQDLVKAFRRNDDRRAAMKAAGLEVPTSPGDAETPEPPTLDSGLGSEPVIAAEPEDVAELDPAAATAGPKKLIRYLPLTGVIPDEFLPRFKARTWPGIWLERVPVREYPGGLTVAPIVGKVGTDAAGTIGAEATLSAQLEGTPGRTVYMRDSAGRPLWIRAGDVMPAVHGKDVRLAIDLEIQRIAAEELRRGIEQCESAGGRCVVLDPHTGEILAMVDLLRPVPEAVEYPFANAGPIARSGDLPPQPEYVVDRRYRVLAADPAREQHPALGKNRCVEAVYEPGSTFKPFVWSIITELGRVRTDEVIDTGSGTWVTSYGRLIQDVKARASQTWAEVLINSSNIGMGKGAERLSFAELREGVRRWGFGSRTGVGIAGEATGLVQTAANWKITTTHSVAFGNEIAVTPLQMVRAYSAFAREGDQAGTLPQVRLLAAGPEERKSDVLFRVIPAKTALLTRDTMRHVAENMQSTMAKNSPGETDWRYTMFGKSGTSKIPIGKPPAGKRLPHGVKGYYEKQYISSFIAGGPAEKPVLIVLVTIDDPGPKLTHTNQAYGALTAGPVNRRIMERALTYLGVPPSPMASVADPKQPAHEAPVTEVLPPTEPIEDLEADQTPN